MTHQQARDALRANGMCPLHGMALLQIRWSKTKLSYCSECVEPQQPQRQSAEQIAAAKKILGL